MNEASKAALASAFCAARDDFAAAHRQKEIQAARAQAAAQVCEDAGRRVAALRETLAEHGIPEPEEPKNAQSTAVFLGGAGLGIVDGNQYRQASQSDLMSLNRQIAEDQVMSARGQTVAPQ